MGLRKGLRFFQYLKGMPFNGHFPPLMGDLAVPINQKGTPLDSLDLLSVHILHFDHVEQSTQGFVPIANQFKGKRLLAFEILMGLEGVA